MVDMGRLKAGQGDDRTLGAFPLWWPRAVALPGWALLGRTQAGHMGPVFSWGGGQAARKRWREAGSCRGQVPTDCIMV